VPVAVAISLTITTDDAKNRFDPVDRGCYFEGELSLKYLPRDYYRYSQGILKGEVSLYHGPPV
jgi:hypothetical protein